MFLWRTQRQLYLDSSNEGRDMVQERSRRRGFNSMSVSVGFMVDKAALGQAVFLARFPSAIAPYSFMCHRRCNISSW
jgi:hypothetical protein